MKGGIAVDAGRPGRVATNRHPAAIYYNYSTHCHVIVRRRRRLLRDATAALLSYSMFIPRSTYWAATIFSTATGALAADANAEAVGGIVQLSHTRLLHDFPNADPDEGSDNNAGGGEPPGLAALDTKTLPHSPGDAVASEALHDDSLGSIPPLPNDLMKLALVVNELSSDGNSDGEIEAGGAAAAADVFLSEDIESDAAGSNRYISTDSRLKSAGTSLPSNVRIQGSQEVEAAVDISTRVPSEADAHAVSSTSDAERDPGEDAVSTLRAEPAEPQAKFDDQDDSAKNRIVVDYASKTAGALILEKSPNLKGTSNLLNGDNDKYAIAPCHEERKYIVVGLSEDILVKQVVLSNHERYSSQLKEFQVLGSMSYPEAEWVDLGTYTAHPGITEQKFDLVEPTWARYLKLRFVTHYGDEHYCTLTQVRVHGSTMLQGFHEQWVETEEEVKKVIEAVKEEVVVETGSIVDTTNVVNDGRELSENISGVNASVDADLNADVKVDADADTTAHADTNTDADADTDEKPDADASLDDIGNHNTYTHEKAKLIPDADFDTDSILYPRQDADETLEEALKVEVDMKVVVDVVAEVDREVDPVDLDVDVGVNSATVPRLGVDSKNKKSTNEFPESLNCQGTSCLNSDRKDDEEYSVIDIDTEASSPAKGGGPEGDDAVEITGTEMAGRKDELSASMQPDANFSRVAGKMGGETDRKLDRNEVPVSSQKADPVEPTQQSNSGVTNEGAKSHGNLSISDASVTEPLNGAGLDETQVSNISNSITCPAVSLTDLSPSSFHLLMATSTDSVLPSASISRSFATADAQEKRVGMIASMIGSISSVLVASDALKAAVESVTIRTSKDATKNTKIGTKMKASKGQVSHHAVLNKIEKQINSSAMRANGDTVSKANRMPQEEVKSQYEKRKVLVTDDGSRKKQEELSILPPLESEIVLALAKKYPAALCLQGLNFQDFKTKITMARNSKNVVIQTGGSSSHPGKIEPIFKTLTDEIKSLQLSQSVYDQYIKAVTACHQRIILDITNELRYSESNQAMRLSILEDAIRDLQIDKRQVASIESLMLPLKTAIVLALKCGLRLLSPLIMADTWLVTFDYIRGNDRKGIFLGIAVLVTVTLSLLAIAQRKKRYKDRTCENRF